MGCGASQPVLVPEADGAHLPAAEPATAPKAAPGAADTDSGFGVRMSSKAKSTTSSNDTNLSGDSTNATKAIAFDIDLQDQSKTSKTSSAKIPERLTQRIDAQPALSKDEILRRQQEADRRREEALQMRGQRLKKIHVAAVASEESTDVTKKKKKKKAEKNLEEKAKKKAAKAAKKERHRQEVLMKKRALEQEDEAVNHDGDAMSVGGEIAEDTEW